MTEALVEAFMARLYTDGALREAFLAQPGAVARAAGLDPRQVQQLEQLDLDDLALAADSFAHKRAAHAAQATRRPRGPGALTRWARAILR